MERRVVWVRVTCSSHVGALLLPFDMVLAVGFIVSLQQLFLSLVASGHLTQIKNDSQFVFKNSMLINIGTPKLHVLTFFEQTGTDN